MISWFIKDSVKLFKGANLIYSNDRKAPFRVFELINFVNMYIHDTHDLVLYHRLLTKAHAVVAKQLGFGKVFCEQLTESAKEFLEMNDILILGYKNIVPKAKKKRDAAEEVIEGISDPQQAYKAVMLYYNSL